MSCNMFGLLLYKCWMRADALFLNALGETQFGGIKLCQKTLVAYDFLIYYILRYRLLFFSCNKTLKAVTIWSSNKDQNCPMRNRVFWLKLWWWRPEIRAIPPLWRFLGRSWNSRVTLVLPGFFFFCFFQSISPPIVCPVVLPLNCRAVFRIVAFQNFLVTNMVTSHPFFLQSKN